MSSEAVVIIPARYASQRLPGKPLISLHGKPMIQWVYERARTIPDISRVLVATDDRRIADAVAGFGGEAMMSPASLANGSERVGWVARQLEAEIVVNLQGDEPLISGGAVSQAIAGMRSDPDLPVATLGFPLQSEADWRNPSIVKVITDRSGRAIYFSRAPIPFPREGAFRPLPNLYRHVGVYVFRRRFLLEFLAWPETPLEATERLEQLRILENGHAIQVVETSDFSPGVDTAEDVVFVEEMIKAKGPHS